MGKVSFRPFFTILSECKSNGDWFLGRSRILFYQAEVECQNPGRKNPFISFNFERFRTFWMGFGIWATVITYFHLEKSALNFLRWNWTAFCMNHKHYHIIRGGFRGSENFLEIVQLSWTNTATENGAFEDVFPIKHGDIPASYVSLSVSLLEGTSIYSYTYIIYLYI